MSINKRKDAAALFELIGKSTLKVPKNAGQLKIPSWWSSRENPASTKAIETDELPPSEPVKPAKTPAKSAESHDSRPANGTEKVATAAPEVADAPAPAAPSAMELAQQKLFDPHAHPDTSPSIRPPATNQSTPAIAETPAAPTSIEPTPVASAPIESIPAESAETAAESPIESPAPIAELPIAPSIAPPPRPAPTPEPAKSAAPAPIQPRRAPTGVFAPKTMDSSTIARRNWNGQQRLNFARMPAWALIGAVVAIGLLIVIVVFLAMSTRDTTTTTGGQGSQGGLIIPPPERTPKIEHQNTTPNATQTIVDPPRRQDPPPPQLEQAKVFGSNEVPRTADLVYLIIATSPLEDIAKRNADFIASKGVSVSIEKTKKGYFSIISVQGYPKQNEAAEEFRKKLVAIGREHPDAKRTRKGAWDDAYYAKVTATPK